MHDTTADQDGGRLKAVRAFGHKFVSEVAASLLATGFVAAATTLYFKAPDWFATQAPPEPTVAASLFAPAVAVTAAPDAMLPGAATALPAGLQPAIPSTRVPLPPVRPRQVAATKPPLRTIPTPAADDASVAMPTVSADDATPATTASLPVDPFGGPHQPVPRLHWDGPVPPLTLEDGDSPIPPAPVPAETHADLAHPAEARHEDGPFGLSRVPLVGGAVDAVRGLGGMVMGQRH